ncbi:hypothetical protein B0H16DRAFT_382566 [Mycena metata]|uniref:Uncharacterized protein n=1 Tax=Mycena metata TaxID=1033252 RepID=A0AAD7MKE5_9AGAR|nr:hypothetical protein B0H16DRAFT_382566 [Mycena metata]
MHCTRDRKLPLKILILIFSVAATSPSIDLSPTDVHDPVLEPRADLQVAHDPRMSPPWIKERSPQSQCGNTDMYDIYSTPQSLSQRGSGLSDARLGRAACDYVLIMQRLSICGHFAHRES